MDPVTVSMAITGALKAAELAAEAYAIYQKREAGELTEAEARLLWDRARRRAEQAVQRWEARQ